MSRPQKRWRDHLIGLGLGVVYLGVLIATASNLGVARDEGFYFSAARKYQRWFDVLSEDASAAMDDKVIGYNWSYNHEHPALMKTLFGFSDRVFHKKLDILSPSTALRLPAMITGALCVYLIFIWGSFSFGRRAGLFAAFGFALMPRVFYHAHLCCFDLPITFFWLLVTYLYWRSLSSARFGLAAGIAFGFALCVKLNAFFLPFVLGLHYAVLLYRWKKAGGKTVAPAPRPGAFVSGLVFAPIIFFAHWPWLWFDTVKHVGSYMGFHSHHPHYNTAYFGQNIVDAPTPVSYPFVLTLLTVPTVIMILFAVGSLIRARHHLPARMEKLVEDRWSPTGPPSTGGLDLLLALSVFVPMAIIAMPNVPIFGGTKHWLPSMPFIALLAGVGAVRLMDVASSALARLPGKLIQAAVLVLLLAVPLQQTITSHPFGLASYVPLMGGARGAASAGMLRQFWGYTTAGVLPWLEREVPKNKGVWFHDTAAPSVSMFREEGTLRRDIKSVKIKSSAYALLHHELHMVRNESWIWNQYRTTTPEHVLTYQGVPMVSIYKRPPRPKKPARKKHRGKTE